MSNDLPESHSGAKTQKTRPDAVAWLEKKRARKNRALAFSAGKTAYLRRELRHAKPSKVKQPPKAKTEGSGTVEKLTEKLSTPNP